LSHDEQISKLQSELDKARAAATSYRDNWDEEKTYRERMMMGEPDLYQAVEALQWALGFIRIETLDDYGPGFDRTRYHEAMALLPPASNRKEAPGVQ
jgi:hypothetical protein